MDAVSLNIVILPSEEVSSKAIKVSQKVSEGAQTEFVLNKINYIPHITVYQAAYPAENKKEVFENVKEITQRMQKIEVKMSKFSISHDVFLFWNALKSNELVDLQNQIIARCNDLREGLTPQNLNNMKLSEEDRSDKKRYGSLLIGPNYTPHITISVLKNNNDQEKVIALLSEKHQIEFQVNSLSL